MKHKYILTQSNEILSYFNSKGLVCFDSKAAIKALPESRENTIRELLSDKDTFYVSLFQDKTYISFKKPLH